MKTLFVITPSHRRLPHDEQQRREVADQDPRISLLERALDADVLHDYHLQPLSRIRRFFYKFVPVSFVQAWEAFRRRHHYDVVVSWDDRFALVYAFLLKLRRCRSRHVAILSWMAPPRKASILRQVQKHIDRVVVWSQSHKALLVEFFGIASTRITAIPYFVDQLFWRPLDRHLDGICSAGDSRRDYGTLIEAMRNLPVTCRIATQVRPSHQSRDKSDWGLTSNTLGRVTALPSNILMEPASYIQLREIYARSHFVVVPVFPSFRDNGITTIAEAMAMGKAVICSRIYGLIDFIDHGENGIFVPPADPQALREAILYLLDHPEVAARMGAEGRRRAEKIFALDHFVHNICCIANDVINGTETPAVSGDEAVRIFNTKPTCRMAAPLSPFSSEQH